MYRSRKSVFSAMNPWSMAVQGTMLAIESQQVIAMRLMKMAMGGAGAEHEAETMVSEKMQAAGEAGRMMVMAALGGQQDLGAGKVVRHYRRKVRANRKRLSK